MKPIRQRLFTALGVLIVSAGAATSIRAAESWLLSPVPEAKMEGRIGAFAHGIGLEEAGGVDINAELLFPRLPLDVPEEWQFLVPRPQIGGMISTIGKTSYAYAGVVWTFDITSRFFVEEMFGGAVHNGKLTNPPPGWIALGCRALFHVGTSLGYRVTDTWTVLTTWEHISNASTCAKNAGLNNYGLKLGYRF